MKKRRFASVSKNKNDFSNRAVIVMLLLLVAISIISIGFYMHTLANVQPKFIVNEGKSAGEVSIVITKVPPELVVSQNVNNLNSQS
ncbi:MAG: hypothetical protein Q7K45_01530 [Nanoarchaeota archaeon]|nr:hypothetical protein [Nanoarchaeota archaeon]